MADTECSKTNAILQFCFVRGKQVAGEPYIEDYFVNTDIHADWSPKQIYNAVVKTVALAKKVFRTPIDYPVVVNMPWAYSVDGVFPPNLSDTAFEVVCNLIAVEGNGGYEFSINVPPANAKGMRTAMYIFDPAYTKTTWSVNKKKTMSD